MTYNNKVSIGQVFADDIVLVFDGKLASAIERQANATLTNVWVRSVRYRLKFAPHKTCGIVITKKLKYDDPCLSMGTTDIGILKEI